MTAVKTEDSEENVVALVKLAAMKNSPAQTVQELLTATRKERVDWLKGDVSIQKILMGKFPIFAFLQRTLC